MIAAEDKIRVIERILETDSVDLLRDIESLLYQPTLADYRPEPISHGEFVAKIERAEEAARRGEVTSHDEVRKLIKAWSRQSLTPRKH